MKKFIVLSLLTFTGSLFAQEDSDRKINAGICIATGINMNKAATKRMEVDGVGSSFTIGLVANYNLSSTVAFASGVEIDFESNKITPSANNGASFYQYTDTKIELNKDSQTDKTVYQWTARKQKPVYLTIPTMIAFRTKYFGDFRYTGKFGLRTSFLLGNKINDEGFNYENNSIYDTPVAAENTTMEASRDMNFIRSSAGLALGAEWNFSGSTSLCAELGFYYGFVPIYSDNKVENTTLYNIAADGTRDYYSNDMTQSQLQLKVSVLF